jgi:hypothetical protein
MGNPVTESRTFRDLLKLAVNEFLLLLDSIEPL